MDVETLKTANATAFWPGLHWLWGFIDGSWGTLALAVMVIAWIVTLRKWGLVFAVPMAVGLTDVMASHWLKPLIARPRPCLALMDVSVPFGCSDSFSMPSAHAANAFAVAAALGAPWAWMVAVVVAFSRVAIAVHYPSDVLVGALLGSVVGLACRWFVDSVGSWRH